MEIVRFEPETLIEIDDTMLGFRKLAIVAESSSSFIDLIEDDASTFPIYAALHPQAIGNALSWGLELLDQDADQSRAFGALHSQILAAGVDSLTRNRALFWAYQVRSFGVAEALTAGRSATDQVRQSRRLLDQLAKRGRAAHLRLVI